MRKIDLELRVNHLETLILEFCAAHDYGTPEEWKQQEHIAPLFREAESIINSHHKNSGVSDGSYGG